MLFLYVKVLNCGWIKKDVDKKKLSISIISNLILIVRSRINYMKCFELYMYY